MTEEELINFVDEHPDFHVVLDNDCFVIYPRPAPDSPWENVWEEWQQSGESVDINPDRFLMLLIEYLGGSVERC